jgi:hypothetical protein
MKRWVLWTVVTIICLVLGIGVTSSLLERSERRAATDNGAVRDFHQVTAEELDRNVREQVPLGSTRSFVEDFLKREGMRFNFYPPTQTISANAPYLKGSGLVYESLGFKFHFDEASKLKSIDSSVHLTGP